MAGQYILPRSATREGMIARIARVLAALPIDASWAIEVREHKPTRSTQQNRYLWGAVYPAILAQGKLDGWTSEEVHEYCLGECFGWETVSGFGRKRIRPLRRSSRLNKQEFADYVAFIQRRMAEHGIIVPDPDTEWYDHEVAA